MYLGGSLVATGVACASLIAQARAQTVFAHFIVGNVQSFAQSDWASEIALAKASGIEGFALNIGGENIDTNTYTQPQLNNAYNAADGQDFSMFISFDYGANPGFDINTVSGLITTYAAKPAQFKVNGAPLVSTFEGGVNSDDWATIKSKVPGGCYFIPDYTSNKGDASKFTNTDGALSWDVWPVGANNMTDDIDTAWQSFLGSKDYMMGISPWFYTDLPQYSKTWTWRGTGLWDERWRAAASLKPKFVEIITWNDFGESHYIGPLRPAEYVQGSEAYVAQNPHDAYRALLPAYIASYKGTSPPSSQSPLLVYAHMPNPSATTSTCSPGDVVGNAPYQPAIAASDVAADVIDVYTVLPSPATITVSIGGNTVGTMQANGGGEVEYFSVGFGGQTGEVRYVVDGMIDFTGATISADCTNGQINFNAVVGSNMDAPAAGKKMLRRMRVMRNGSL